MELADLLAPNRVEVTSDITSKKGVLEKLSELIASADPTITTSIIFNKLIARERLGSTGLGHGVAIPHGRNINQSSAIGACIVTHTPVDFDAIDNEPVDIFFALSVPEAATDEHLAILAKIAEMFENEKIRTDLRQAYESDEAFRLLTSGSNELPKAS